MKRKLSNGTSSALFSLIFSLFLLFLLQACGGGSGEGSSSTDGLSPKGNSETKTSATVTLGYVEEGGNSKGTTSVPPAVLSATLKIDDIDNGTFQTRTTNTPDGILPITFRIELEPAHTYNLTATAFSGIDGGGASLYSGTQTGVIFSLGVDTSVEMSLALVGTIIAPTSVNVAPSNITGNSATLEGTVNPNGFPAVIFFEWGTSLPPFPNSTPIQITNDSAEDINVTQLITGLLPNTQYYYRLVAENGGHQVNAIYTTFTTLGVGDISTLFPVLPTIVTDSSTAVSITQTTATLQTSINPEGSTSKYYFQWGFNQTYGNTTDVGVLSGDWQNVLVQASVTGLTAETTYNFRVVTFNSEGLSVGQNSTFITAP